MRVLLAPHGTRGDVQPMIALALALRANGHAVSFVLPDNFVAWARAYGFDAAGDGIDVAQLVRSAGAALDSLSFQMRYFVDVLVPRLFDALSRAPDADVIVGAGVQFAGGSVAEARGCPYVSVAFCPCIAPSAAAPPPMIRTQTFPRWVNRAIWTIGRPFTERLLAHLLRRHRRALGLRFVDSAIAAVMGERVIVAADRDLGPLAEDAPEQIVATDAWTLEEDAAVEPRVEAFLSTGPPPVYVGFGSMVADRAGELARSAVAAIRAIGMRTIVAGGWAELQRHVVDEHDVLVLAAPMPHHQLLPHVAAVIHHGGAGTTTAAARAGRPQVVLPHILDQFYWAHRVAVLGLGPRALPAPLVTADLLADRVDAAVNDPRIAARAASLGAAMQDRDGLPAAVELLESIVDCRA